MGRIENEKLIEKSLKLTELIAPWSRDITTGVKALWHARNYTTLKYVVERENLRYVFTLTKAGNPIVYVYERKFLFWWKLIVTWQLTIDWEKKRIENYTGKFEYFLLLHSIMPKWIDNMTERVSETMIDVNTYRMTISDTEGEQSEG
jgi:hypothetical protein